MNLNLNYEGYEANLVKCSGKHGGIQYLFRFGNNFGASVVKHSFSYGSDDDLWELAVLEWRGDDYDLTYDTDITCDVEGSLTDEEVRDLLGQIKDLK